MLLVFDVCPLTVAYRCPWAYTDSVCLALPVAVVTSTKREGKTATEEDVL